MATKPKPPENGFMRIIRRVVAVVCLLLFAAAVAGELLGLVTPISNTLKAMLLAGSTMMFDAMNEIAKRLTGGSKK